MTSTKQINMKQYQAILATGLFCIVFFVCVGPAIAAKPNIIFIVGDDCGYSEFSFNGQKKIPTPRIDSIANGGITCTQGYVSAAVCAPSRAGLMTGRYQQRFGFLGNLPNKNQEREGIPLTETVLPDVLKTGGYRTIAIGKWHLGWIPKFYPCQRGFDHFYGFLNGSRTYFPMDNPTQETQLMLDSEPAGKEEFVYITDELGQRAAKYIDQYSQEPFFLYLAFNATHSPKDALDDDLKTTDGNVIAAMTIALDRAVGNVLDSLDRNNLTDNTLIVFISDNGGVETHNNKPLRGYKRDMYEGGIRVPFAIRWPKMLPAGKSYDMPVSALDLFSTSLSAAEIPIPDDKPLDGVNLIPYLTGENEKRPHEVLYWTYGDSWAVRDGDMKLVLNRKRKGAPELFDLSKDISEKNDLATAQPQTAQRLQEMYETWNSKNLPSLWGKDNGDKDND